MGGSAGNCVTVRDAVLERGSATVLTDVSFVVPCGSLVAVVGANGSGKSTLLDALAGLTRPAGGSVEVLGGSPAERRDRIAYVLQSAAVNERVPVTVRDVVAMARYARRGWLGRLRDSDWQAVESAMATLGVSGLARKHPGEISGGERQRVLLAQALAQEADLLLLDEPVTALDVPSRDRILAVVEQQRTAGKTAVMATHDLSEAADADVVVLLGGGRATAGSPEEILTAGRLSDAYGTQVVRLADGAVMLDDPAHH